MFHEAQAKKILFGGRAVFEMWGKPAGNMSLAQLKKKFQKMLGEILEERGIGTLFAPNPAFNAEACGPDELTDVTHLPGGAKVLRGCKADCIVFGGMGNAGGFSPADCATGVLRLGNRIAVLHCGTKCMIDAEARSRGEKSDREFESVIQSAFQFYGGPEPVQAFVGGSIAAANLEHPFDHPEFGAKNQAWVESIRKRWPRAASVGSGKKSPEKGCVSLSAIFLAQALEAGVRVENTAMDDIDTSEEHWWSNRRGDKERNFVLVYPTK